MRYFYLSVIYMLFISLLSFGCGRETDTRGPEYMQLPFDTAAVVKEGRMIKQAAFRTLSTNLKQAMQEGGVEHALQFCSVEAMPLTDSLSTHYDVQVRRASHRPRNPSNRADSLEMVSIRNYLQQIADEKELAPLIYSTRKGMVYHAPIRIPGQLCLSCHGQPGTDITESNLELIRKLYPEDEATGFAVGELRGIWTIQFPDAFFDKVEKEKEETGKY